LLAYAEQLLRLSAEAELALRSGKPRGKLRIGTLESTAATRLPPVLARYHRANPEVQIELVTGTTAALLEQVLSIRKLFASDRGLFANGGKSISHSLGRFRNNDVCRREPGKESEQDRNFRLDVQYRCGSVIPNAARIITAPSAISHRTFRNST